MEGRIEFGHFAIHFFETEKYFPEYVASLLTIDV